MPSAGARCDWLCGGGSGLHTSSGQMSSDDPPHARAYQQPRAFRTALQGSLQHDAVGDLRHGLGDCRHAGARVPGEELGREDATLETFRPPRAPDQNQLGPR